MNIKRGLLMVLGLLASISGQADVTVFACEPEWAELARELGGEYVNADSGTTAFQDAHYIQARPSLIAKVRNSDLVICTGANLEIGWLPPLLRKAGNPQVQPGQAGFFEASQYVDMLQVPATADRAAGDIHPYGNPHVQTNPHNIERIARALVDRLVHLDPDNTQHYRQRGEAFLERWKQAIQQWERRARPLQGMQIVVHHNAWVYMNQWLGLREMGQLEPKPGLPPTAGHLSQLQARLKGQPVRLIVRAAYKPARASEWLSERIGIPFRVIPHTVGATEGAEDLFGVFDDMIATLLEARQ